MPGVIWMKKKKASPMAHELRDCPVPPVKGAVTDQEDVLLRLEGSLGPKPTANLDDTIIFDSWM